MINIFKTTAIRNKGITPSKLADMVFIGSVVAMLAFVCVYQSLSDTQRIQMVQVVKSSWDYLGGAQKSVQ